jgi:PAS domain S-box-containing protein
MKIGNNPVSTGGQPQDIQPRHRPADGTSASSFHGGPINILIVDDDPKNLTVLETVLDNPGYRLVKAESGDQALLALVSEEFALLILDIRMPGMNGLELAQLIKERKKTARVPIIFLTAFYEDQDQHMLIGYGAGAVDYLQKPVNPAILRSKVAVFADLHNKNRALLVEVAERRRAQEQLHELNATLEQRVSERTEALRRSERNLSEFFDNASVGLHWVGPDGIIIKVNQAELDLLGYSREEYVGRHIAEFHIDQPAIQDILERLASRETLREYPARIRCKDGSIRDVLINSNVLFEDDEFIHTRCFTRDITAHKRAEEALRENEERFRMLADNISQFAWTADPTGWIFWYNRRWYEYTGTTFEEMQGWGWEKVHHPDHLDRVVSKWRQAHTTGESWEDTFPLRGLDGTYRWFLSRALPIRNAEGQIIRWFGTNTDITELREMQAFLRESEERLKRQTSTLAEINKELESFSYSISHDLRAPLRTIVAFNHILEEDHGPHLNDDARRCVTIVHKAAIEAGQLIDDLLDFSRLGRQDLTVHVVSMANLAQEATDELKVLREGRKIDMLMADLPPCQGDRRLLKLVWNNLLENAVKYTKYRHEARIEVGWMPDDASAEAVTYYVKDDGVGFDMQYAHKLFGVFQRLHKKEDFEGTGVGLAIVQRIVHRHGGRVWAQGAVDGGATLFFSLRKATA